ncbi:TPA: hypothetical protein G9A11_000353 [Salmonella enterica]|uniref:Uncharacterized protein n=1 Tax=Salmonella enterica TaxID=28901 RepID=A0A746EB81_SALER|nr:hypothetical protein [Salmonella enterica]
MKEHAASVTQEACDYRGVHAEGLSGQQHQMYWIVKWRGTRYFPSRLITRWLHQ